MADYGGYTRTNGKGKAEIGNDKKYYPPTSKLCVHCYYARMRTDICGIYCTRGFVKHDGTCDQFKLYRSKDE